MNDLSIIRVLVPDPPRIIRIPVPGIPGPRGPQGPEGPPGLAFPYVGDAVKDEGTGIWTGTDYSNALNDWIGELSETAISEGIPVKGRIPRGKYLFTAPIINTTDTFQNLDIGGDGDATVLVNKNPTGGGFLPSGTTSGQTSVADVYLTSPAVIRDQILTVNTTAGFVVGQWLLLRDPSKPLYAYYPDVYSGYAGQAVKLREIIDSTHIRLDGDCEDNYAINTMVVRYQTLDNFYFHDFAFDYDPSVTAVAYAMDFIRCSNVRVERILMRNRNSFGIRGNESFMGDIFDLRDFGAHVDDVYSVEVQNSSAFWRVGKLFQYNGRHAFDAGGDQNYVPASDITVYDSKAIYPESNGFDTHNNCRRVTFDSVRTVGWANPVMSGDAGAGVLVRGLDCRVINSEFIGVGIGVYVSNRGGALVQGNSIWRCRAGVRIGNADNTIVRGNFFKDCVEHFIEHADALGKTGFIWENNIGFGNPSLAAFYMPAAWDPTWVLRNNQFPDSTNPYGGVPDQLYQTHLATGTHYVLTWADGPAGKGKPGIEAPVRRLERQNAGANDVTLPADTAVPLPIGTTIEIVQVGVGVTSIICDTGVTLNGISTPLALPARYSSAVVYKRAANTWVGSVRNAMT